MLIAHHTQAANKPNYYKEKITTFLNSIEDKPLSELANEGTIITSALGAGIKTYGYLAGYATFKNPYLNGTIHYASFQAAYGVYLATAASLTYAQKILPNTEETEENDKKNKENDTQNNTK